MREVSRIPGGGGSRAPGTSVARTGRPPRGPGAGRDGPGIGRIGPGTPHALGEGMALVALLSAALLGGAAAGPHASPALGSAGARGTADAAPSATSPDATARRALALAGADEPGIEEVQAAAAREALRAAPDPEGFAARSRLAGLVPRVTAEYRRSDHSYRTVGLQSSGEVDYLHLAPSNVFVVRAVWDLPLLVAAHGELGSAAAAAVRARRVDEAVKRATVLYYQRAAERVTLLLAPPEDALGRARAALELARLDAELDALTGGLLSGRGR